MQLDNITAAKCVADVIRTCLGPRAMLKMLMDPMGGIVMTSDGTAPPTHTYLSFFFHCRASSQWPFSLSKRFSPNFVVPGWTRCILGFRVFVRPAF